MMLRREFLIGTLSLTALPKSSFAFSDVLIVNRTETCGLLLRCVGRENELGWFKDRNCLSSMNKR